MFADYGSYRLFPADKFAKFQPPHADDSRTRSGITPSGSRPARKVAHHLQLRLLRSADRSSPAGQRRVSHRPTLEWDAANLKATNCPAADQYIRKQYRSGWEVA